MIHYLLIVNEFGKIRTARYYTQYGDEERRQLEKNIIPLCQSRRKTQSSIMDYESYTVVYKNYGAMMFIAGISEDENELAVLELFQHFLETLHVYFGNITEKILIYNLDKVHMVLDEMISNGVVAETSPVRILAPLQLMATAKK